MELEEIVYRTLHFSNLPNQTSSRDLVAVIRGGTLVGINLRSGTRNRNANSVAMVSFLYGAAEYPIEVNWADKRFRLISHVKAKMDDCGAIRNLLVGSAVAQGITAEQVREDMDHIHKLTIVDMPFQTATPMLTRALRAMLFTPDPAY
ncbi:hypothetical protein AMS68_000622 [Peltaster fructicola]|uniref:Uncharacterized protein n=1 Tax=Peltaster fructicola TaxID=286661 RepID=A0A6H0XKF3_9PEZI|nr:hypothetical protein AMS68_000622 [Peltaster fructicola]